MARLPAGTTKWGCWQLHASSAGSKAHSQLGWSMLRANLPKGGGRPKTARCSTFPLEPVVFTATRLNASALRLIGPGSNFLTNGLGSLLAVDEFFVHPFYQQEELLGPNPAERLTYFLEENHEINVTNKGESQCAKHGIQVLFQTCKKDACDLYAKSNSMKLSLQSSHVKDAGSVETFFLESASDKGGAKIRVIVGQYESVLGSVEENFVLLDAMMRPGSVADIPFHLCSGLVIYVLEGVGVFNRHPHTRPFYENEGHGIWFPPSDGKDLGSPLHVTCHMWSSLRFLVLAVPVS